MARLYVMAIAQPSIEKIFWYDFRNDTAPSAPYDRPAYNDNYYEFHYGLLRRAFQSFKERAGENFKRRPGVNTALPHVS